jgi:hypothetical protein
VVKHQTELNFKLIGKFGSQVADQGIQSLDWTNEDQTLMSYVRGTDNIVQVFDTKSESVIKQRKYENLSEIRGLHSVQGKGLMHIAVDKKGLMLKDDLLTKQQKEKPVQLKGDNVFKSYLQQ